VKLGAWPASGSSKTWTMPSSIDALADEQALAALAHRAKQQRRASNAASLPCMESSTCCLTPGAPSGRNLAPPCLTHQIGDPARAP
jgi:hypothetical protein